MKDRIAIENQYRCLTVDMLEKLLLEKDRLIEMNKTSNIAEYKRDEWVESLQEDKLRIQDGIDNNIHNE